MKTPRFSRSTAALSTHAWGAAIALACSLPAMADPLAEATMAVFEADGPRQVDLARAVAPTLTVFTPDGAREVAMTTSWPEVQGAGYLKLSAGARHDEVEFTIGGRGNPNVLSELKWSVPAGEIRLDGGWTHTSGFTVKGYLAYGAAVSGGEVRDSDYAADNRQKEFSRAYGKPDGSEMLDVSLGAGWRLPLGRHLALTPMFGLARMEGTYRFRQGNQALWDRQYAKEYSPWFDYDQPLGDFAGLNSRYRAVWSSLWQGLEAEFAPADAFRLRAGLKHHWFRYKAEADWNLRGDFAHPVSFTHKGYGRGWEAELGADWRLAGSHRLSFDLGKRELRLRNGTDTTHFANGSNSEITLGSVTANSWSARLGYRYDY